MQKSWSHLAAVSVIITAGINIITVLPFMVGATGDHLGFSKLSLGWFAAADTTGVMISGLSVYQLGKRWSLRGLVMTGLFVQMLLHLVSLLCALGESLFEWLREDRGQKDYFVLTDEDRDHTAA